MASVEEPVSFRTLLRRYRVAAGLSQQELAERAGLSRRGISDLERGTRRTPHPTTVRQLSHALNLAEPERAALVSSVERGAHTSTPPAISTRHNLPLELTTFIGRDRELKEVAEQL